MTTLRHYPLGETCPNSPHAVVSSLPTMADVRGYAKGDARVLKALKSGYPRFRMHSFIERLIDFYFARAGLSGRSGFLIPGRRAVQDLVDRIGLGVTALKVEPSLYLLHYRAEQPELHDKVRRTIQHIGSGLSSRQAEDLLCAHGLQERPHPEAAVRTGAQAAVEVELARQIGCAPKDVLTCASGMNAFYTGFRAVEEAQAARGRTKWLQIGWLYLDSGCILDKFLGPETSLDRHYDATDTEALLERIEACGDALACVVIECPTNPIIQVADLECIHEAVRRAGGILMVDPTIASIYNVKVLPFADILVTSLTKYAAYKGDVMLGAVALNPDSPFYGDLVLRSSSFHQPPYARDLARLATEMQTAPDVVARLNANAATLAAYLRTHPAVKKVYYAGHSAHFTKVAKRPDATGSVITIELCGSLDPVYDALALMKGPSFGTEFTLICPFMYLAHYDLATTDAGRKFLAAAGIEADLIRISVGTEQVESVIQSFEAALGVSDSQVSSR